MVRLRFPVPLQSGFWTLRLSKSWGSSGIPYFSEIRPAFPETRAIKKS